MALVDRLNKVFEKTEINQLRKLDPALNGGRRVSVVEKAWRTPVMRVAGRLGVWTRR